MWVVPPLAILLAVPLYQGSRFGGRAEDDDGNNPIMIVPSRAFSGGEIALGDLAHALDRARPDGALHDVSSTLHMLRLWGPTSAYGMRTLACLMNNDLFVQTYHSRNPWIVETRYGARFAAADARVSKQDAFYEPHPGYTLSVFAEIGVPLTQVIQTSEGKSHLRNIADDLIANYSDITERDWLVMALALYLPPQTKWENKFGELFSFDSEVSKLVGRPLGEGSACSGTHTLHTLGVVVQADGQRRILTERMRDLARGYLRQARDRLVSSQGLDGSWNSHWSEGRLNAAEDRSSQSIPNDEIHITGHILEWLSITPSDLGIPQEPLKKAVLYVCRTVARSDSSEINRQPCDYLHGIRAACLLSGIRPTEPDARIQVRSR